MFMEHNEHEHEHEQCDATVEYRGNLCDAGGTEWYAGNFVFKVGEVLDDLFIVQRLSGWYWRCIWHFLLCPTNWRYCVYYYGGIWVTFYV